MKLWVALGETQLQLAKNLNDLFLWPHPYEASLYAWSARGLKIRYTTTPNVTMYSLFCNGKNGIRAKQTTPQESYYCSWSMVKGRSLNIPPLWLFFDTINYTIDSTYLLPVKLKEFAADFVLPVRKTVSLIAWVS